MNIQSLLNYCRFETSRSSGPGGQHVNKTESKVSLYFNIAASTLYDDQKKRIFDLYPNKINSAGEFYLQSFASRSQAANKEAALLKLFSYIEKAIVPPKKRLKTKRSKASVAERLAAKKHHADKKKLRKGKLFD